MKLWLDPTEFSICDRADGYVDVTYRGYILPSLGPKVSKRAFYLSRRLVISLYADYFQAVYDRMSAHQRLELLRLLQSPPERGQLGTHHLPTRRLP